MLCCDFLVEGIKENEIAKVEEALRNEYKRLLEEQAMESERKAQEAIEKLRFDQSTQEHDMLLKTTQYSKRIKEIELSLNEKDRIIQECEEKLDDKVAELMRLQSEFDKLTEEKSHWQLQHNSIEKDLIVSASAKESLQHQIAASKVMISSLQAQVDQLQQDNKLKAARLLEALAKLEEQEEVIAKEGKAMQTMSVSVNEGKHNLL